MKTLLRIDTSARTQGSHSRALTDHYQSRWLTAHPDGRVVTRDLACDPIPHIDQATIDALCADKAVGSSSPASALSDTLIAELFAADAIVIGAPLYNFGVPSTLKAYFDHIVRSGRTFMMDAQGKSSGLVTGKTVCVITARGGAAPEDGSADASDFQTPYLASILAFVGLTDLTQIRLAGTAEAATRHENLVRARAAIDALFSPNADPEWIGVFTAEDRQAIGRLRDSQAAAVAAGDVEHYTSLVADDVHWMFPGRDVVTGRARFHEAQRSLRNGAARILSMRKAPLRVERAGDLAIEIGRQELVVAAAANSTPTYPPKQKYTHIFRKTSAGWRFAVLMSNSSG